jgi:hypothetical protein
MSSKPPVTWSWKFRKDEGWRIRKCSMQLVDWVYIAPDGTEFTDESEAKEYTVAGPRQTLPPPKNSGRGQRKNRPTKRNVDDGSEDHEKDPKDQRKKKRAAAEPGNGEAQMEPATAAAARTAAAVKEAHGARTSASPDAAAAAEPGNGEAQMEPATAAAADNAAAVKEAHGQAAADAVLFSVDDEVLPSRAGDQLSSVFARNFFYTS